MFCFVEFAVLNNMKALLLFFIFSFSILAGDTVTTVNRPQYLGGGFVTTVKSNGATTAKVIVVERPKYLGGGSNVKVVTPSQTSTATIVVKPPYLGGGVVTKVK